MREGTGGPCPLRLRALVGPFQDGVQGRTERLAPGGEPVLDFGRHLGISLAVDDAGGFQAFELLSQHLLGDAGDGALEVRKALDFASEEVEKNHQLPTAFQQTQGGLDIGGGGDGGVGFRQVVLLAYFFVRTSHFRSIMAHSAWACKGVVPR